jgi:hypothetical protein
MKRVGKRLIKGSKGGRGRGGNKGGSTSESEERGGKQLSPVSLKAVDEDEDDLFDEMELQEVSKRSRVESDLFTPPSKVSSQTSSSSIESGLVFTQSSVSSSGGSDRLPIIDKWLVNFGGQDWNTIKCIQRHSFKKILLRNIITPNELLIGVSEIKKLLTLPSINPYHIKLEYPKVYVKASDERVFCIELVISAMVHFMLHLLTIKGLLAKEVWRTTISMFVEMNRFGPSPIISQSLLNVINAEESLVKKLKKIPENWKTLMRKRSLMYRQLFLDLLPSQGRPNSRDVILRLVCCYYYYTNFLLALFFYCFLGSKYSGAN